MPLNIKSAETFAWPVVLQDNPLTEEKNDRMVTLLKNNATKTVADLATDIARERTEYREETLTNTASLIEQKMVEFLLSGESYSSEFFHYEPSIQGVFNSKGEPVDPAKVKFSINVAPIGELRKILANQIKLNVVKTQTLGGAAISRVLNLYTGEENIAGRTDLVAVEGSKIKSVGPNGEDKGGEVSLVSELDVKTVIEKLGDNTPTRITFMIPEDLAEGQYRVQIETYYAGSDLLKNVRVITSEPITIG